MEATVVEQTFDPRASVGRDKHLDANQVWAWRKLCAPGLVVEDAHTQTMLPVVVDVQSERLAGLALDAADAPIPPVATNSGIQLPHGKDGRHISSVAPEISSEVSDHDHRSRDEIMLRVMPGFDALMNHL